MVGPAEYGVVADQLTYEYQKPVFWGYSLTGGERAALRHGVAVS